MARAYRQQVRIDRLPRGQVHLLLAAPECQRAADLEEARYHQAHRATSLEQLSLRGSKVKVETHTLPGRYHQLVGAGKINQRAIMRGLVDCNRNPTPKHGNLVGPEETRTDRRSLQRGPGPGRQRQVGTQRQRKAHTGQFQADPVCRRTIDARECVQPGGADGDQVYVDVGWRSHAAHFTDHRNSPGGVRNGEIARNMEELADRQRQARPLYRLVIAIRAEIDRSIGSEINHAATGMVHTDGYRTA